MIPTLIPRTTPSPGTLEEPNRLRGYAARFDEPSRVLVDPDICKGPFIEVIRPGAFARTLRENPDIRALYNHDRGAPLGRTRAGTLALAEDELGLAFDLTLPDTQVARDLRESLRRGDIDGCSFYGYVVESTLEDRPGLPALHTILDVELVEITPATTFPAYPTATVALRSVAAGRAAATPRIALARARLALARD